jgi:hypothetical protein
MPAEKYDPVRSVSDGKARHIDSWDPKYRMIRVTDSSGKYEYEYVHVDWDQTDGFLVPVSRQDSLGTVVSWGGYCPVPYHHLHFTFLECDGAENCLERDPLIRIRPDAQDNFYPRIGDSINRPDQRRIILFPNESPEPFDGATPTVHGDVDIVVDMYIEKGVMGSTRETVVEVDRIFPRHGMVPPRSSASIMFKWEGDLKSYTSYCGPNRDEYYYVVTNKAVEDGDGYWDTDLLKADGSYVFAGPYVITVYAKDQKGNVSRDSLSVTVDNINN